MIREAVAHRLVEAQSLLPTALRLVVVDGWRTLEVQQRLIDYYGQLTVDRGFVAAVDSVKVPPHVTGGTADLTLLYQGEALALGTDFDDFNRGRRCHVAALEDEPQSVDCLLRRLLYNALLQVGFAPYTQEWWHFSFGDENWASFYGRPGPLFGAADSS
ncbi:M15 family metallopeptidase [Aeromicrobium sp. UC242_57]|uniref:M15 family metallopeptidase n=1 Tax=Aeromicrobium sp. UC242_57 TaxID=3374624 RepID=UPI0037899B65